MAEETIVQQRNEIREEIAAAVRDNRTDAYNRATDLEYVAEKDVDHQFDAADSVYALRHTCNEAVSVATNAGRYIQTRIDAISEVAEAARLVRFEYVTLHAPIDVIIAASYTLGVAESLSLKALDMLKLARKAMVDAVRVRDTACTIFNAFIEEEDGRRAAEMLETSAYAMATSIAKALAASTLAFTAALTAAALPKVLGPTFDTTLSLRLVNILIIMLQESEIVGRQFRVIASAINHNIALYTLRTQLYTTEN